MLFVSIVGAVLTLVFIILLSLLLNARKVIQDCNKRLDDQSNRTAEAAQKYNRQLEVRHAAIKQLLHGNYEVETMDFFAHLSDPSSHIPDSVFEKVDAYQTFIVKKKGNEKHDQ